MNLPWKDRPRRELIRLAWPIAVSTLSYSVMTVVDTMLIGHVGRSELAGVGLGGMAAFMLLCFSMGLLQGAKVLVSQALGAGRNDRAGAYLGAAVATALVLGVLTCGIGQVAASYLPRLAASEAAGEAAATYMRIRLLGAPMILLYVALREVRYAYGDARTPMRATVAAQLVNIALAIYLVRVLDKGVGGAAFATVVAHTVEAGVLALTEKDRKYGLHLIRAKRVAELFHVGLPTGLQLALEVSAFGALTMIVAMMSDTQMAAHQIALQVLHFSFLPAMAVAEAGSVLIGQAVGAGEDELVPRISRLALVITGVYASAWTVLLACLGHPIVGAFTPDTIVVETGARLLLLAGLFQLFDAANMVARCALRGAGDVRFAAAIGVLLAWLCTPTLAWLLGVRLGWGAAGGWIGLSLELGLSAVVLWIRLERGGWRSAAWEARRRLQAGPAVTFADGASSELPKLVSDRAV